MALLLPPLPPDLANALAKADACVAWLPMLLLTGAKTDGTGLVPYPKPRFAAVLLTPWLLSGLEKAELDLSSMACISASSCSMT